MPVVLDTSVLLQGRTLRGLTWRLLYAFARHRGIPVVVPEIAVQEYEAHVRDAVREASNAIRGRLRSLERLGITVQSALLSPSLEAKLVTDGLQLLVELRRSGQFTVAPIPETPHSEILRRLFSGEKPFGHGGANREKGYRDYLVWKSLLAFGGATSAGDPTDVFFISANTSDFADADGSLHHSLAEEAYGRGLNVLFFKDPDEPAPVSRSVSV